MVSVTLPKSHVETQDGHETHCERLLRIAEEAKDAKSNGGVTITRMTREERRIALFPR
ncbi:hypothetical protein SAMN04487976_10710 [Xaviernesmea oryzae]|nr:hypothetical protein SAMN04487976_10710 [Xaviernesmea oryzae]